MVTQKDRLSVRLEEYVQAIREQGRQIRLVINLSSEGERKTSSEVTEFKLSRKAASE